MYVNLNVERMALLNTFAPLNIVLNIVFTSCINLNVLLACITWLVTHFYAIYKTVNFQSNHSLAAFLCSLIPSQLKVTRVRLQHWLYRSCTLLRLSAKCKCICNTAVHTHSGVEENHKLYSALHWPNMFHHHCFSSLCPSMHLTQSQSSNSVGMNLLNLSSFDLNLVWI